MNRLLTILAAGLIATGLSAQEPATIADRINASGIAVIFQPAKLNARLMPKESARNGEESTEATDKPTTSAGGYRLQIFSGNNARTANAQATGRAEMVREQFPEYATYVTFTAPYWRLRVGDFATYEDATAALARLKAAFPDFAREIRVVRDKVNLQ